MVTIELLTTLDKNASDQILIDVQFDFFTDAWFETETKQEILPFLWQEGYPRVSNNLVVQLVNFNIQSELKSK